MGDQFLKCLNNLRAIREIYLEAPEPNRSSDIQKDMCKGLFEAESPPARKVAMNRMSTYCLDEFRPCNKTECSFRLDDVPDVNQQHLNETEERGGETENVIVVSPFDVGQNDHFINDVRVHVLYGNEAPFDFERQTNRQQPQPQDQQNDDDCGCFFHMFVYF